jgi:hypothetical protein
MRRVLGPLQLGIAVRERQQLSHELAAGSGRGGLARARAGARRSTIALQVGADLAAVPADRKTEEAADNDADEQASSGERACPGTAGAGSRQDQPTRRAAGPSRSRRAATAMPRCPAAQPRTRFQAAPARASMASAVESDLLALARYLPVGTPDHPPRPLL